MARIKFVILARSRTGSTWLMKLLSSHPDINIYGEILGSGALKTGSKRAFADPIKFIKDVFRRGKVATGFKLFYYHARGESLNAIWEWLGKTKEIKIVHLKRRNILRTHVSKMLYSRNYKPRKIDYDSCLKAFRDTRRYEKEAEEFFGDHPVTTVYYEDLQNNPTKVCSKILKFLGLSQRPLKSRMKKQNRKRLSQNVLNYAELKRQFVRTEWAHFFDE